MPQERLYRPAFGQADLTNCEREQIHLAGSIQPHGVLLVAEEPGCVVVQASRNASDMLGISGPVLGRAIGDLPGNLAACIGPHLESPLLHTVPLAVRCAVGTAPGLFDVAIHRPPQGGLVIELEAASAPSNRAWPVVDPIRRMQAAPTLRTLCDDAAWIIKDLTGYDRVMVYRFDEEGHGEVVSEERLPELEPFLGNHYPATDIPQIARRLYERNRVRVLVDIEYEPVPVLPGISPLTDQPLDMSLSLLRSISPIHVQYLRNMGVRATLVVSLMVGGRLWGLIACHHAAPRTVPFDVRVVCELLAETMATRIAALESAQRGQADLAVRRLEQRLTEAIRREGDWCGAMFDGGQSLLQPLRATGAALLFDGQVTVTGEVPGTQQLREIGAWLDARPKDPARPDDPVYATTSLGRSEPAFLPLRAVASGLGAVALSSLPGEYLLWFRPEQKRTRTWGGDPTKPVNIGDTPQDLSPRRSFAQWHQVVEQTSEPWTDADLTAARLIGDTVRDVILQFRSVGLIVAQQVFETARRQVGEAELPVLIAGADGRILLLNHALAAVIGEGQPEPLWLDDLPDLFADAGEFGRHLFALRERGLVWRGRVRLRRDARPLLIRADPVLSSPGQTSGFVLLFNDLRQQEAAEAARLSFQIRVHEQTRAAGRRTDPKTDGAMQAALAAVVENAQLAALEITDGLDVARLPEMLESVRASVARARRAIDHLSWHADSVLAQHLH